MHSARVPNWIHSGTAAIAAVSLAASLALAGDVGTFVDEAQCAECHRAEADAWRGSHHDLAMQDVERAKVLAPFAGESLTYGDVITTFSTRGERFVVATDGPDGKSQDFDVRYLFGVTPLQQYLLPLPAGRLQALSIAWDDEKKRWYHLYPDEKVDFRDELHWTKPSQNWNYMCAECHSTDVDKGYDAATNGYDTRWFRIDVGCQACHGPGASHVEWARSVAAPKAGAPPVAPAPPAAPDRTAKSVGLAVDLAAADNTVQIEACARCHARRSVIAPEYEHGKRLADTHLPALLDEQLYHADGQILGEVYEYGSFIQSKMFAKGVRCSDCHDAHSGRLKAEGNALCISCHNPTAPIARTGLDTSALAKRVYDSPEHHFHEAGKPGSRCVDCHAPSRAYMGIDLRADHSFRIPRPDLTESIGTPNACNGCHTEKTPRWAADAIRSHAPAGYAPAPHYGTAIHAGREGKTGAARALTSVTGNAALPAIARATALRELLRYPGRGMFEAWRAALVDPDPLVRREAANAFELLPPNERAGGVAPLLADPTLAVRIEAARLLAPVGEQGLVPEQREAFRVALAELDASYRANEDRVEGRVGRGNYFASLGRADEAEAAYLSALALEPNAVPAAVNLADFYRAGGNEEKAETTLRQALTRAPRNAALERALALTLVRRGRKAEALELLASSAVAAPDQTDIVYTYAVALADAGRRADAIGVLEKGLAKSRGDRRVLLALAAFHRDQGDLDSANAYLEVLRAINPDDPALTQ